jgi:NADH:ubiquinone oxidoreductase subunit 5 (subunit L)/multisubunit Na+/H+ antiporter MnhA subunit
MGEEWGYEGLHVGFEEVPVIFMIAVAIFISWWIWGGGKDRLLAGVFIRGLFERKFFLDEIEVGLGKGMTRLISAASGVFDRIIIDGFVNRVGSATRGISSFDGAVDRNIVDGTVNFMGMFTRVFGVILRYLQAGVVEFYLLLAILGVFALVWLFVL